MNTFLLAWNPKRWEWDDIESMRNQLSKGFEVYRNWSCRSSKVQAGDRVFIIRLGEKPKGIFASGVVEKGSHLGPHWELKEKRQINYVTISFNKLINPEIDGVNMLFREELEDKKFQPMHWSTQMSGVRIPDKVADHLVDAWKQY